jgi:hypothetical protein
MVQSAWYATVGAVSSTSRAARKVVICKEIDPRRKAVLLSFQAASTGAFSPAARPFSDVLPQAVITGFNTDIEHDGVVYHVQTEDKGVETPLILSLVYVGGAILASKRTRYDDLVGESFDAAALSERLNRQHKLICAAITAGRIEDLKRLSRRDGEEQPAPQKAARRAPRQARAESRQAREDAPPAPHASAPAEKRPAERAEKAAPRNGKPAGGTRPAAVPPAALTPTAESQAAAPHAADAKAVPTVPAPAQAEPLATAPSAPPKTRAADAPPEVVRPSGADAGVGASAPVEVAPVPAAARERRPSQAAPSGRAPRFAEHEAVEAIHVEIDGALYVNLLEERDYHAGEIVTLRVRVSRGPMEGRESVGDASVTVKILGTEFRPLILTSKTDQDGVAVIHAWLPRFTRGRAAILIRAACDGYTAELRRAIRHV